MPILDIPAQNELRSDAMRKTKGKRPGTEVLVVGALDDAEYARIALNAGWIRGQSARGQAPALSRDDGEGGDPRFNGFHSKMCKPDGLPKSRKTQGRRKK